MPVRVRLGEVGGADASERAFIERALARLSEALADPTFLPAVAAADYLETHWTPLVPRQS